ncbi:MAG TPA: type I-C CRISPR-associated protein Cas5 [Proteobacteria bacterium]|nr:type I-C CRISPR-associated protein Cas5 [Pseudomonadota bacterium]
MNELKNKSEPFRLLVWGRNACFTRPEMKVERVSYDVMTPSAARGILEAILWKPAIRWRVTEIDLLNPIRWESVRRNEVGEVIRTGTVKTAMKRGRGNLGIYIEKERQQRAGLFLRDVKYIIHAFLEITKEAGDSDNVVKFQEMFLRRVQKGQCFHRPYLGCREFAAHFKLIKKYDQLPELLDETRDLGWMLLDMDYSKEAPETCFFQAKLEKGRLKVPLLESREVRS